MIFNYDSVVDLLIQRGQENADKTAFIFQTNSASSEDLRTYGELDKRAKAIAVTIKAHGLKKGDRALLIFVPGLDIIEAYFGCLYAGVVAVPVYFPSNAKLLEKTRRIIKNAMPKVILMTQGYIERYGRMRSQKKDGASASWMFEHLPCIATDKVQNSLCRQWQHERHSADDLGFIQYTSGSTSHPKGVMITHANLRDNISKIYQAFGFNEQTVGVSWLPPYHDMGLIGNILVPIHGGFPCVLMTPFSFLQNPLSWLQNVSKYRATASGGPNFAYDYCVRRIKEEKKRGLDLSSWQLAFNGAEPVHTETMEHFYQAFKDYGFRKEAFYPCYGLAEATLLVAGRSLGKQYNTVTIAREHFKDQRVHFVNQLNDESHTLVSSGCMIQDIKIVDPETLLACKKDRVGEIWVKSASVAHGYWHHPKETAHVFQGKIKHDTSQTSYLRTGDLGFIHDNELYVTGRMKDLIILDGKHHYPQLIEYTLHHSHVHSQLGVCAAFVTSLDKEYRLTVMCEAKTKQLQKSLQEQLIHDIFEVIYQEHQLETHRIVLTPRKTIPKTTSGKVRRNFCRQQLLDHMIPLLASWELTEERRV